MTRNYTVNPNSIKVRYGGLTLKELADKHGVSYEAMRARHKRGKWTEEEMLEGKKKRGYKLKHRGREATLKEWADETGISINVLRTKLKDFYVSEDILRK